METEEGMAYTINGVKLVFPCKAYPTQLCMMDKIIKGVERQQNSLLESPTGSGKSLALLCSCLAWQTAEYEKKAKLEKKMNEEVLDNGCCSTPSGIGNEHPLPTGSVSMDKDKQTTDAKVDQNNHVETITIDQEEPQDKEACSTPIQTSVLNQSKSPTDDDFQPLKKRFRTPSNQQAATKSVKRRRVQGTSPGGDEDHEPPEWTMELTADSTKDSVSPATSDDLGKKGKCSPDGGVKAENIKVPTIFFGTRTHKQIAQITRELGKTVYKKTRMSILSSREHSCVHPIVSKGRNKNEECKKLLDGTEGRTCRYKLKVDTIGTQVSIKYQGLASAWDIEDLVTLGNRVKACPYYASRDLMREADIVFCPYNYLIDPKIRRQMEIDLTDQIVVLDEAHNVEDSARDSASFTINAVELQELLDDIDKMVSLKVMMEQHRSLHLLVGNLLRWIHDSSATLKERGFEQSSKVWSGMEIVAALEKQGITPGTFIIHWKHFEFVLKSLKDPNREMHSPSLSSQSLSRLEGIFLVAQFMLGNEMKYISDYRVAIMKTATMVRNEGLQRGGWRRSHGGMRKEWTYSLNFWCLNPAVVFSEIGSVARCIILTSGTLSPMTSFSSELGIKFPIQLEANHVIANSQVWVGTLSTGPNGSAINASYHSAETFTFQDEVGRMVLSVCETVPHGVLCFFPSYSMLDKLSKRWQATGLWSQLMEKKDIVSEPRSGDKSEFDDIMHQFYHAVRVSEGEGGDEEDSDDESSVDGGLFLAVCRGKVSEGLDFADNNARAVITVGIPFPNFKDVQLELKRKYNNQYSSSRGLLNGSEWYEIQAYRALNQALGRCIRHKQDWGAILLIDERFNKSPKYINGISKWVRHRIQRFHDFGLAMASLKQFACARKIEPCPTILSPHSSSQQNKSTVGTPGRESCATPCTAASVKPPVELTPLRTPLGNTRVNAASPTVLDACDIAPTTLCFPTDAESTEPIPNQHEARSGKIGSTVQNLNQHEARSAKIGSTEPNPNLHKTRSAEIGSIEPNPNLHKTRSAEIGSPSVKGTTRTVASQGSDCHQDLKTSDRETPSVVIETDFSCSPVLFTTPCPSPSASPVTTAKVKVDCGQQGARSEKKTDKSSLGKKEHGGNNFDTFESLKATFLSQERVESENKGMVQKDDDFGKEPIGASEKSNRVIEVTGGPTMRKLFKSRIAAVNGPNREEHDDETADCLIGSDTGSKPRDDVKENISSEKSKRAVCVQTTVTEKCLAERNSDENEQESAVDLSSRLRSEPAIKSEPVARTNVRRSQRKNTRMRRSSRGDGQATQHRQEVPEKVDERSIGNVLHCLQCGSDLYSGHVTPEPITRSLRDTLCSSLVPTLDERSVLRTDKTTSGTFNLCPLVDLNSERSSSGLKLNSLYISETECCYIPQVCRMCSTNGDPAQVVGVEVISFKATSEQESHQPLSAKQVWLFQHMVSCSKRD